MNTVYKKERGQTLVIIVMGLIVFLAFLALALDGGYTWAMRRKAQTAADAGALAGARQYCAQDMTEAESETFANTYATTQNGATTSTSEGLEISGEPAGMRTETAITFNTFFAHLIGRPTLTVEAEAEANCLPVGEPVGVLPVGWSCRPQFPTAGGGGNCDFEPVTEEYWDNYVDDPTRLSLDENNPYLDDLYLIMDGNQTQNEVVCLPEDGGINCDLDGDGKQDVFGSGDRSWLNLDGGSGSLQELVDWISLTDVPPIYIHSWVPNTSGDKQPVYPEIHDNLIEKIVTVPVFDSLCENQSIYSEECTPLLGHPWVTPQITVTDRVVTGTGNDSYAHITAFAGFAVTCVNAPQASNNCPLFNKFTDTFGAGYQSYRSVEGFFVGTFITGYGSILPGATFDPNTFVVKLRK